MSPPMPSDVQVEQLAASAVLPVFATTPEAAAAADRTGAFLSGRS